MTVKIGVIGEKDAILPFKLFGFTLSYAKEQREIRQQIDRWAKENYGIIYMTETTAEHALDTIERYKEHLTPAIVLIPSHSGVKGIGRQEIQKNVEKAVGQNVLD